MLSVLDWLKDFANNYGSLTTLIFGAIGALATYLFGGMLFRALAQHRIQHLEKELDEKKDELSERNKQLEACCGELVEVRLRADALDGRLRVVTSAFEGGNDNLWVRRSIPSRPKDYDEKIPKGIPILLLANLKGGCWKNNFGSKSSRIL